MKNLFKLIAVANVMALFSTMLVFAADTESTFTLESFKISDT